MRQVALSSTPWARLYGVLLSSKCLHDLTWFQTHSEHHGLRVWDQSSYLLPTEPGPESSVVPLDDIIAPVIRHAVVINGQPCWLTLPLRTWL